MCQAWLRRRLLEVVARQSQSTSPSLTLVAVAGATWLRQPRRCLLGLIGLLRLPLMRLNHSYSILDQPRLWRMNSAERRRAHRGRLSWPPAHLQGAWLEQVVEGNPSPLTRRVRRIGRVPFIAGVRQVPLAHCIIASQLYGYSLRLVLPKARSMLSLLLICIRACLTTSIIGSRCALLAFDDVLHCFFQALS